MVNLTQIVKQNYKPVKQKELNKYFPEHIIPGVEKAMGGWNLYTDGKNYLGIKKSGILEERLVVTSDTKALPMIVMDYENLEQNYKANKALEQQKNQSKTIGDRFVDIGVGIGLATSFITGYTTIPLLIAGFYGGYVVNNLLVRNKFSTQEAEKKRAQEERKIANKYCGFGVQARVGKEAEQYLLLQEDARKLEPQKKEPEIKKIHYKEKVPVLVG